MRSLKALKSAQKALIFIVIGIFATICASEEPNVVIDSLSGKAEVQRAGNSDWKVVREGVKLYNNDILRILDRSTARLEWENGSIMYVHANSQILINLYKDKTSNLISKHTTVFMGAVFFIIKKALPKGVFTLHDTKVFTPTAALAIRGTSFEVDVEKTVGKTDIKVLNGTILVGNILRKESIFLSAGYRTRVTMNNDPLVPEPILDEHIDSLKIWVPPPIVDSEMNRQIGSARRDHLIITGKLEDKLIVTPISNSSSYKGLWNISSKLSTFLANKIQQSFKDMSVLTTDKQDIDIVEFGKKQKARFVLTGNIKDFEVIQRAEISAQADKYEELCVAKVGLHIQLIDVGNNKMIYESDITGEIAGKNLQENSWHSISKLPLDMKDKKFSATILAQAIDQAMDQSVGQISRYMK